MQQICLRLKMPIINVVDFAHCFVEYSFLFHPLKHLCYFFKGKLFDRWCRYTMHRLTYLVTDVPYNIGIVITQLPVCQLMSQAAAILCNDSPDCQLMPQTVDILCNVSSVCQLMPQAADILCNYSPVCQSMPQTADIVCNDSPAYQLMPQTAYILCNDSPVRLLML